MSSSVAQGRLQILQIYRLIQWVHKVDKVQIEKMVQLGVQNLINLTEPQDGIGVLHVAVSANNPDLVNFLVSLGADPNIQDKKGHTPIMLAAELGNDPIVSLLAHNRADLRLLDAEGKGVLFYCVYPTKRHSRCLQVLLKCGADANNVSAQGTHIFHLMCEKAQECTPLCLLMLDAGADPNAAHQKTGVTVLMEAAKAGSLPLVRAIIRMGGDPNALDTKRHAAVHYAAMGGFFEVIQVLSAHSADMSVMNLDNCTPLHYAAASGNANCCKFLVQRGCNPKLKNQEGVLPRQIAKGSGYKAAAKELRKAERKQGKGSSSSSTGQMSHLWALTLHDWSQEYEAELWQAFGTKSDTVTAEMFISVLEKLQAPVEPDQIQAVISSHGGDGRVNISDFIRGVKYIAKPFRLSSYMPKKKRAGRERKGSKKKKKDKFVLPIPICTLPPELKPRRADGGPPNFMIGSYFNCSDIRRFDSNHPPVHPVMNDSGWYIQKPPTAYINVNYCVRTNDLESLDYAFSEGVPVDVQDEFYKTPLMVACSSGNCDMAQYLLSKGADVNVCDQFFWTPLHHAAHAGQLELIELLVSAGANIDAKALGGGTPLMRAIESSRVSCVDFLINTGANVLAENKKEQNCLDLAKDFANSVIIDLVRQKMDSLPKPKDKAKRKRTEAKKPKSATAKVAAAQVALQAETSSAAAAAAATTPPQKDSNSVILQNSRITAGKTRIVDITFVPKTVWGKPPTTSQLMSKIERGNKHLSLEVDLDDLMTPFSHDIQGRMLELPNTTE
ncbi:ankyrin repeat and EF-hand domain-containing protein 1 [Archocentrus centrarchus]|uniref:ankyrin repeat and EF-hand domain-containing protein 1 n=1 Tax=Archocentrus centrarchus TaxID=63155 RepID=UPI0011EA38E9|nr:ankyrin repeat and EF-hand domain-containing protein 1 [Archocentrus centrarchus]